MSRIIGCPSWAEFAGKFLDDLHKRGLLNYFEIAELSKLDPRKSLSICYEIYKENKLDGPDLKEILKEKADLRDKYEIYGHLYDFNAIYVTTNYDDHLDKEALKGRPAVQAELSRESSETQLRNYIRIGKIIYKEEDLLISNLENGNVIHLHGSINEPKKIIVTLADYLSKYSEEGGKIPVFLSEIFGNYTVVFVGYGLEEYEILEFMISRLPKSENSISHYILLPFFKNQKKVISLQKKYYASVGIELIDYSIDEYGYSHLARIIEEWAKGIRPISKSQMPIDKIRLVDEVLD